MPEYGSSPDIIPADTQAPLQEFDRRADATNPRPPEKARRSWLWQTYGITPETYEAIAADKLRQIARSLVNKLAQGDASAMKQVLERIDRKAVVGASQGTTALSEKDVPALARCEIERHVGPRGNCCDRPVGTQRLSTDPAASSARQRLVGG